MITTLELSLSPDNVPTWGLWEGVREYLSNYLDEDGDKGYYFDSRGKKLHLINRNKELPKSFFATGVSSKREDVTTRGTWGEGSGAAMCCLLREGYKIQINTGDASYVPYISHSDKYHCDMVFVATHQRVKGNEYSTYGDVHIIIEGIGVSDYDNIKSKCLYLQDSYDKIETSRGDILTAPWHKGKVFCGGMYVNTFSELDSGYDINPEYLKLDRDRHMVRQFDIAWITKEMWAEHTKESGEIAVDYVANSVIGNVPDTRYLHHNDTQPAEALGDACYDKVVQKFGDDVILAESAEEQQQLSRSGYKNVVYTGNETLYNLVSSSSKYKTLNFDVKPKTVNDFCNDFYTKWCGEMSSEMERDFQKLVKSIGV